MLAEYRDSFRHAYLHVTRTLADRGSIEVTGRTKSNLSIERKLTREPSLRLSQMQDIEGCRLVVADYEAQEIHVHSIAAMFARAKVVDRRSRPSFGYRAVHVIVEVDGFAVEVQIRTTLQDLWAQLCERVADELGEPEIKYGGGPGEVRRILSTASRWIGQIELGEKAVSIIERRHKADPTSIPPDILAILPLGRQENEMSKAAVMAQLSERVVLLHAKIWKSPAERE